MTPGEYYDFGVIQRVESDQLKEIHYISFTVSEDTFLIYLGGSVYEPQVGSDSYTEPEYLVELNGPGITNYNLHEVECSVQEFLNLGAQITVSDNLEDCMDVYEDLESEISTSTINEFEEDPTLIEPFMDSLTLIISREEIETHNIQPALSVLERLMESPFAGKMLIWILGLSMSASSCSI
ncbi:MAG: hypothetical protein PHG75_05530 [Syntrophomonas sp.]|nr:hypothetical protein [Syntrophomonas sp.]